MASLIRLLHLSDLHYSGDPDQRIVIDALKHDLESESALAPLDLAIFSGDLVEKGGAKDAFPAAKACLEGELLPAAKLPPSRLVVCPGNHDINRNTVRKTSYIEAGLLQTLKDRESINTFIDENTPPDALLPPPPALQRLRHDDSGEVCEASRLRQA